MLIVLNSYGTSLIEKLNVILQSFCNIIYHTQITSQVCVYN